MTPTTDFPFTEGSRVTDPEFGTVYVHRFDSCFTLPLYYLKVYDGDEIHEVRRTESQIKEISLIC